MTSYFQMIQKFMQRLQREGRSSADDARDLEQSVVRNLMSVYGLKQPGQNELVGPEVFNMRTIDLSRVIVDEDPNALAQPDSEVFDGVSR